MKNKLLTLAGGLALVAVIGKYYAVPAIAQTVRAALVKNIDERGRIPYQQASACGGNNCVASFPSVPGNKRLVIEYVNLTFSAGNGGTVPSASLLLGVPGGQESFELPTQFIGGGLSLYGVSAPMLVYVEPGQSVSLNSSGAVLGAHISGYLVDLNQ